MEHGKFPRADFPPWNMGSNIGDKRIVN